MKSHSLFTFATTVCLLSALAFSAAAGAATILASDFTGVVKTSATGVASGFTWDTVGGIIPPATSLAFVQGDDGTTTVGFFNVRANEIDVNRNMTVGGWDTSFEVVLSGSTQTIELTELILDMRLTNGSGADNTTSMKSGRMAVVLAGSASGVLGTVDPGNSGYPGVVYTRTLDLSSFPTLDTSETYTLTIQARGTGHGHHKSLQAIELTGAVTIIPEPSTMILAGLGLAGLTLRRRRR